MRSDPLCARDRARTPRLFRSFAGEARFTTSPARAPIQPNVLILRAVRILRQRISGGCLAKTAFQRAPSIATRGAAL
jgi:hypothetical protein